MTGPYDVRERARHLYQHPEEATHEDVRALVVMSEALREARQDYDGSWRLVLSVWQHEGPRVMVSQPYLSTDGIMDLGAALLARMGIKPKDAP